MPKRQFTPKPGFSFPGKPPKEALEYFRRKGVKPSFHYADVWREEHAASFTVAKAMELDVLTAIRAEVDKALAEGRTLQAFSRDLTPALQRLGWWGRKEMADPITGEVRKVQLGSPRRLRTVYNTNMRTARVAGQWERIQRGKKSHPYLLYGLGPAQNHRPEHVAWNGTLLQVDDPWWNTHMPPNDWGCHCRVRQVSEREAETLERRGVPVAEPEQKINPDTGLPTGHLADARIPVRRQAPPVQTREWINRHTGEVHQVPKGIGPGWDYNPGRTGRLSEALGMATGKLDKAAYADASATVRQLVRAPAFTEWYRAPKGDFPIGVLKDADAALVNSSVRTVRFSPDTHAKQLTAHPEITPEEYLYAQEALERGELIQDSPTSLVKVLEAEGYVVVVKATKTGKAVFLTSLRRLSGNAVKRDEELRRMWRKLKKK